MKCFRSLPATAASFVLMSLAALTPGHAATETAITVSGLNMRAGPGTQYPVMTVLPGSSSVTVYGCTASANWCDVGFGYERGWVSARYLQIAYNDELVFLTPAVGTSVGITVIKYDDHHDGGHHGGGNGDGHNGGSDNGGQDDGHGFFKFVRQFGKDGKIKVGVTDNAIIGAKVDENRRGKRTVTAVKCDKGGCNTVLKAENTPNGKSTLTVKKRDGRKTTSIEAEKSRRGKSSVTVTKQERRETTSVNVEKNRRGKRTLTAEKCRGGNCKGVVVTKGRDGKPDVDTYGFDRSSNKSRDNASARSSRGSRDAKSGGRSRNGGFSRGSGGSRNTGNRRG